MMRLLLVSLSVLYFFTLVSCATDEAATSDDEVAAAAESADTASATEDAAAPDDAVKDAPDAAANESSLDEMGDADVSKESLADNSMPNDEQSLEDELDKTDKSLEPEVAKEPEPSVAPDEPAVESQAIVAAPPETAPPQPEKVRITNIRYLSNQAGGTVVIEATGALVYHAHSQGSQFVVDVDNADLPNKLMHPYPLHDFSGAFSNLSADQSNGQTRIMVALKSSTAGEPIVQSEGNSILIVPSATPVATTDHAAQSVASSASDNDGQPLAARTLEEFLTGNQAFYGKSISIQTKDADIRDVINFISEESGANIVMSDDVKGKISLKVRKIPWDQALVTVMRAKKLGYVRQGNVLRVSSMTELQEESEAAVKMIEVQKNLAPVVAKVIPINYASVDELKAQVTPFLSKEIGKVVSDPRSNTLLITDHEAVIEKVLRIIRALDIQPNQVMIEGKIVEAQENFNSFLGVNWGISGVPTTLSAGGGYQGAPIQLTPSLSSQPNGTAGGVLNSTLSIGTIDIIGSLTATLALAETDGIIKVVSSPRIATMNKEKATITQASEQISLSTTVSTVSNQTTTTAVRTPVTLELSVTPQITADSSVIMDVDVRRQFPGEVVDPISKAAPINTRSSHTKLLVHNGQTMVIGGIYTNDETQSQTGVPGLMDVPVIGWLFKSRTKVKAKDELLIFLTPKIIQSMLAEQS